MLDTTNKINFRRNENWNFEVVTCESNIGFKESIEKYFQRIKKDKYKNKTIDIIDTEVLEVDQYNNYRLLVKFAIID